MEEQPSKVKENETKKRRARNRAKKGTNSVNPGNSEGPAVSSAQPVQFKILQKDPPVDTTPPFCPRFGGSRGGRGGAFNGLGRDQPRHQRHEDFGNPSKGSSRASQANRSIPSESQYNKREILSSASDDGSTNRKNKNSHDNQRKDQPRVQQHEDFGRGNPSKGSSRGSQPSRPIPSESKYNQREILSSVSDDGSTNRKNKNPYDYQRKCYYDRNSRSHLPDVTEMKKFVQTKEDFPVVKSEPIFISDHYEVFVSPETRANGLYIRVRYQTKKKVISGNVKIANAFIPFESTDEEIRKAVFEAIEVLNGLTGRRNEQVPISQLSLPFLKRHFIEPLAKKSENFPEANYYCSLCDFHLTAVSHIKHHFDNSNHFDDEERSAQRCKLIEKCKKIGKAHFPQLEKDLVVVIKRLDNPAQSLLHETVDKVFVFLKKQVFSKLEEKGLTVTLNEFGSTHVGVHDSTDCLINISYDIPDLPLHRLFDITGEIVAILEELGKKNEAKKSCSNSTIEFRFENHRVRLELRANSQVMMSKLLKTYCLIRPQVRQFLMLIRWWAKMTELDDRRQGMAKYGFDLMVIHYLQSKKYLPVLHELVDKPLEENGDEEVPESVQAKTIRSMQHYLTDSEKIKKKFPAVFQKWNWAQLFVGFFEYFTEKHINLVIQITQSGEKKKELSKWNKKGLHVVDPFRSDNVIPSTKLYLYHFFNCFLVTYLNFVIPRTKNGPLTVVNLIVKTDAGKKKPEISVAVPKIPNNESHMDVDEEEEDDEEQVYLKSDYLLHTVEFLGKTLCDLTVDDLRQDSPSEKVYSAQVLRELRCYRNEVDISLEDVPYEIEEHEILDDSFEPHLESDTSLNSTQDSIIIHDHDEERCSEEKTPIPEPSVYNSFDLDTSSNLSHDEGEEEDEEEEEVFERDTPTPQTSRNGDESKISAQSSSECDITPIRPPPLMNMNMENRSDLSQVRGGVQVNEEKYSSGEFFIEENISVEELDSLTDRLKSEDFVFSFEVDDFTKGFKRRLECQVCSRPHLADDCPQLEIPELVAMKKKTTEEMEELDEMIEMNFKKRGMQIKTFDTMNQAVMLLEKYLKKNYKDTARLTMFGSVMTGMGFEQSDVDICFRFETDEPPPEVDQIQVIKKIAKNLYHYRDASSVIAITTAKVPIVKFKLQHEQTFFDVDLSYYNVLALRNTDLLRNYTFWSPNNNMAKLALFVKHWAKTCTIGDASKGSLSSYAHILFLIHYLQKVEPACIPFLQQDFRDETTEPMMIGKWDTYFHVSDPNKTAKWSKNTMSLGELFLDFLDYFAKFDYKNLVVQTRRTQCLSKLEKEWNKPLCVEDPFDRSHNLGAGISKRMFVYIQKTIIYTRNVFFTPNTRAEFLEANQDRVPNRSKYLQRLLNYMIGACKQGDAPADRLCRSCHRVGHYAENCPSSKGKETRTPLRKITHDNNDQKKAEQEQPKKPWPKKPLYAK